MSKKSYEPLINMIRQELAKRYKCKQKMFQAYKEASRDVHSPNFSIFVDNDTRNQFVDELVIKIKKVDNYLEQVAGRHHERHRQLVSLLVELFELEKNMEHCEKNAQFSGGHLHLQNCEDRKTKIKSRIEEIIGTPSTC